MTIGRDDLSDQGAGDPRRAAAFPVDDVRSIVGEYLIRLDRKGSSESDLVTLSSTKLVGTL